MSDTTHLVATQRLYIGYALAHNPGDLVPAENVKANGWDDGVAKPGTKAAEKAVAPEAGLATPVATPVVQNDK